jgi:cytochrome c-type biogenesis protein CcmH
MRKWLAVLLLSLLPLSSWAGVARDLSDDPETEKRMVGLAENLRCLVCQNESLASSHAELAEDLRREVREQIRAGKSDKEITDYLVARYGDFVLYKPPVKSYTMLLWFGPFALLFLGGSVLFYQLRKRRLSVPETELTSEDQQRAATLLNNKDN